MTDRHDLEQRLEKAEWVLNNAGFRRCDIPACNCNSWHQVGGYRARFDEIKEAVEEADYSTNGKTLLDVVKEVIADAKRTGDVAQGASLRQALIEVTKCETALRMGGPAPEDLEGLSIALEKAVEIAANALDAAQPQVAPVETKSASEMIAACYEGLCPDGSSALDFEWARQRGYILPNNGSGKLSPAQCSAGTESDPFRRAEVEAICRAVCKTEGVDPDGDTFGDGCDPVWTRYADAVFAALIPDQPQRVVVQRCDGADDLEHLDGMLDDRERG